MTRLVIVLIVAFLLGTFAGAQTRAYTLAIGMVSATDSESTECYFQFGHASTLALHPKGEPCIQARELVGRTGRLVFMVDDRP